MDHPSVRAGWGSPPVMLTGRRRTVAWGKRCRSSLPTILLAASVAQVSGSREGGGRSVPVMEGEREGGAWQLIHIWPLFCP